MSRPSVRSGFVLFGAVTLVVIGMATPAQAHAIVTSSQPEPGQLLGTAPGVVVLELSEPLNPRLSRATVTDPAGQRFTGGVSGAREIRVSLSTNAQGVYRVEWTTVSTLDGHAVRGSFQFGVGVSPGGAAETGGGATPTREDLFTAVARWVEAVALLLAVGMLFLRRLVRGRPELSWARPHSVPPVLLVALAAGVAVVALEAGSAAGSASPAALWSYLSTGLPGLARLLRLGFEALAVAAAFLGAPSLWLWVTGALGALAYSGHGAAVHPTWWGITVDAVHLVAAGMWAGGILAMAILRPPSGWRSREAREFLVRFSPPALAAFAVTVGFGAIQALQELGALQALTGSRYGQVLLAKIALVALMVPLSIVAWRLGRPHLRYEGTVAVLVVAAAVVLAAFPVPPSRLVEEEAARAATPSASAFPGLGDLTMGGHAGQVLVGLTLDPGKAGTNRALVYLLPLEGNEAAASLRAHLLVGGQSAPLSACGDTCRRATVAVQGGEEITVRVTARKAGRPPSTSPASGAGRLRTPGAGTRDHARAPHVSVGRDALLRHCRGPEHVLLRGAGPNGIGRGREVRGDLGGDHSIHERPAGSVVGGPAGRPLYSGPLLHLGLLQALPRHQHHGLGASRWDADHDRFVLRPDRRDPGLVPAVGRPGWPGAPGADARAGPLHGPPVLRLRRRHPHRAAHEVTALAALIVNRLRGCHSFHDAPLRSFDSLDFQPSPGEVIEGLAQERIVLQPHERFQDPLDDPHQRDGTPNVLQEQQPPSRPENPRRLGHRLAVVLDRTQRQRADDCIESLIGKLQGLSVPEPQINIPAQLAGSPDCDVQHLRAELQRGQAHIGGIEGEVPARAGRDLQDIAPRSGADPLPPSREEQLLEEGDPAIVGAGALVPLPLGPPGSLVHALASIHSAQTPRWLMRRLGPEPMEAGEDPSEKVKAGPFAPAVGFARALVHSGALEPERHKAGQDVAQGNQLEGSLHVGALLFP